MYPSSSVSHVLQRQEEFMNVDYRIVTDKVQFKEGPADTGSQVKCDLW